MNAPTLQPPRPPPPAPNVTPAKMGPEWAGPPRSTGPIASIRCNHHRVGAGLKPARPSPPRPPLRNQDPRDPRDTGPPSYPKLPIKKIPKSNKSQFRHPLSDTTSLPTPTIHRTIVLSVSEHIFRHCNRADSAPTFIPAKAGIQGWAGQRGYPPTLNNPILKIR